MGHLALRILADALGTVKPRSASLQEVDLNAGRHFACLTLLWATCRIGLQNMGDQALIDNGIHRDAARDVIGCAIINVRRSRSIFPWFNRTK